MDCRPSVNTFCRCFTLKLNLLSLLGVDGRNIRAFPLANETPSLLMKLNKRPGL